MSKSISPELKEYIRECVKSAVKEEVASVRKELVDKLGFIKKQLEEETTTKIKNSNDKQLQLITRDTSKQLDTYIKREVMPKLNAFSSEMRERTLDGGQVVTDYRKRVMLGVNGVDSESKTLQLENGQQNKQLNQTQQKQSLSEFQKKLFVFTEND